MRASVTYLDHLVGNIINTIDELGLRKNTIVFFTGNNGSAVSGCPQWRSLPERQGRGRATGAPRAFHCRAPFLSKGSVVSRDLIDFTDLYPTFLDLAGITSRKTSRWSSRPSCPAYAAARSLSKAKLEVYSQLGEFRMIRDWNHIVDNKGSFHNPTRQRPSARETVSKLDKIARGRRQRLQMILERFPENATSQLGNSNPQRREMDNSGKTAPGFCKGMRADERSSP